MNATGQYPDRKGGEHGCRVPHVFGRSTLVMNMIGAEIVPCCRGVPAIRFLTGAVRTGARRTHAVLIGAIWSGAVLDGKVQGRETPPCFT